MKPCDINKKGLPFKTIKVSTNKINLINVTGFWKTNQNITLGLFVPANGYIHTLHINGAITRLG